MTLTNHNEADAMTPNDVIQGTSFKPHEFNHLDKMDVIFLAKVVAFRLWHGFATLLTSDWRNSTTSTHGKGLALDMVLYSVWKQKQPSWFTIFSCAMQWGFKGVGIYFDWTVDGKKVIGLHVDDGREHPLFWIRHQNRYYYYRTHSGKFTHLDGRTIDPDQLFAI